MRSLPLVVSPIFFFTIAQARLIWSSSPADSNDIIRAAYPIGNGKIAALPFGEPGHEKLSINRDSLWTGGPFENSSYNGGNNGQRSQYLPSIRDWIFHNGTGNVTKLMGDDNDYGSYAVLGNLSVAITGLANVTNYNRALDLGTGVHATTYSANGASYTVLTYCSYVDDVCVYDISSTKPLPTITISMENTLSNTSLISTTCSAGHVQLRGITQSGIGMIYQSTVKVVERTVQPRCTNDSMTISSNGQKHITLVLAAGTNFNQSKGNADTNYSFRGDDPKVYVQGAAAKAAKKDAKQLLDGHIADYSKHANAFQLNLPDTAGSSKLETTDLIKRYNKNVTAGDPYLEALTFDFARHLFISSSRDGSLAPNLQGKWATGLSNAWGADYHSNINLQMNHWLADQVGLGTLQSPLWEYMSNNWATRGTQTAKLLYNASGWVTHDEMNIFGHTAMKTGDEIWADYPISAAWMMQHVWDYFDYSQDVSWLEATGYPLLKGIAQFWLSQLQTDTYFEDGTLVVNPCTSAEHGPTTFGCTHYQQLIYQVFETTLQSANVVGETNQNKMFLGSLRASLSQLDKGLHIGSWGQIQEWKIDLDVKNDTHRHLSNLVGFFPGWSLSAYQNGYTNKTIQDAVATTLYSRGPGIADANAGWEKVWRAACWARLNNTDEAYRELRLTIRENWAANLLSMYSGKNEPFQIDANFGFAGAVLSMLVVDLPRLSGAKGIRTVVLGPAIPKAWGNGSVKGLRLRGGGVVDFEWGGAGVVQKAILKAGKVAVRIVNRDGRELARSGGTEGGHV